MVGDNTYKIILPQHMHIYLVVSLENLKLYEPSMLDQEKKHVLPFVEELAWYYLEEPRMDTIM